MRAMLFSFAGFEFLLQVCSEASLDADGRVSAMYDHQITHAYITHTYNSVPETIMHSSAIVTTTSQHTHPLITVL